MKIAILGGSFNPLHNGHAMVAESVIKELGYDKVIFIPTCMPPHKEIKSLGATTEQRLEMVKVFCRAEGESFEREGEIPFLFDSCEIDRGGVSYTYDTLKYITEKCKDIIEGKPGLIMGEEIAAEFHKWNHPELIAQMADLIIVPRLPDYSKMVKSDGDSNCPTGQYKGDFGVKFDGEKFGYDFKMLSEPVLTVSSTDIRKRIKAGKSFKYLVPSSIFEYIEHNKLYR